MILLDTPRLWDGRRPSAHLISDLAGPDGTAELVAFGDTIGLRARWLQEPGTPREHFDLFGRRLSAALVAVREGAGLRISYAELGRTIEEKRVRMQCAAWRAGGPLPALLRMRAEDPEARG